MEEVNGREEKIMVENPELAARRLELLRDDERYQLDENEVFMTRQGQRGVSSS